MTTNPQTTGLDDYYYSSLAYKKGLEKVNTM